MKRKTLHLICQAHIDPVWLWPWRDGAAEVLTTVQSAVDRAAEFPDFKFTRASAQTYRWIEEMDPRLFAAVRRLVRAGRWEIAGGWIEQPDCNLPSTESFIRQSLYGQAWFESRFGRAARIGYNVDSFGHADGLPQLLKRAGLSHYVFMRPQPRDNPRLPDLFWWQSPDGSRVLTQRIPGEYSQPPQASADQLEALIRSQWIRQFSPGFDDGLFFLGIGNHGGGPTRRHLARILEMRRDESLPELRFSTLGDYFAAVERSPAFARVPVIRGGLQYHARGCYSVMGDVKLWNRRAEVALRLAEASQVAAALSGGQPARRQALEQVQASGAAWWPLLFNQFHDILAGTCVPGTFPQIRDSFGTATAAADQIKISAVLRLARQVDTRRARRGVLFAFNPLPWRRRTLVQCDTFIDPEGGEPITHLRSERGSKWELQWMEADANFGPHLKPWGKLTALVDLPPCGYQVFGLEAGGPPAPRQLRTRRPKVPFTLSSSGFGLAEWQTPEGREILAAPLGVVVISDRSDTWGHGAEEFRRAIGRPKLINSSLVESGPLVSVFRQKARWRKSDLWLDIRYIHGLGRIELCFRLDWRERRQIAKLELPTKLTHSRVLARTAGAVTERTDRTGEESCHDWLAAEGRLGGRTTTVALLNQGSQSWDYAEGNLRTVLTRCVPLAAHDPQAARANHPEPYADEGWQERRFALLCTAGPWTRLALDRAAAEFQSPAEYMIDSGHEGTAAWNQALLSIMPSSLAVLALKLAEDGRGLIVRVQELAGRRTQARISLPGRKWSALWPVAPWSIVTLRVLPGLSGIELFELDLRERQPPAS